MRNTNVMIILPPAPKGPGMINSPPLDVAKLIATLRRNPDIDISLADLRKEVLKGSQFYQERGVDLSIFNDFRRCLKHILSEDAEISRLVDRILSGTQLDGIRFAIFSVSVCEQFPLALLLSSVCLAKRIKVQYPGIKIVFFGNSPAAHAQKIQRMFKFIDAFPPAGNEVQIANFIEREGDRKIDKDALPATVGEVNFDIVPLADFSLMDLESYKSNGRLVLPYELNKGCINRCFFCYYIYKGKVYLKDTNKAVAELMMLSRQYGTDRFHITDAAVNMDPDWLMEFCTILERQNKKLKWCALAIPLMSTELLDKLKSAGCVQLRWGVESGSERMLKKINKGTTRENMKRTLAYAHSIGINNYITLITGLSGEKEQDLKETEEFLQEIAPMVDSAQECLYSELGQFPLTVFEPVGKSGNIKKRRPRYKELLGHLNILREDIIEFMSKVEQ